MKNVVYDIPFVGKRSFLKAVRKIAPSLAAGDITLDRGAGGIRGQLVNIRTRELAKGADKIMGDGIIFNMAPSPGASFCLGNAEHDAAAVARFLGNERRFDRDGFRRDLLGDGVLGYRPATVR
jgi:malate dehydrogenase (quinone)